MAGRGLHPGGRGVRDTLAMSPDELSVQVEFVPRVSSIDEALWRECFPPPLEGHFWYQTLETCGLEDQFAFSYALIKRGAQPVGIAPCFLHDVPIALVAPAPVAWVLRQLARVLPRVGFQRTFFIGSPCADAGTIGLVPGMTLAEVAPALRRAVRAKAREVGAAMIVFKDFPTEEATVLTGPAEGRRFFPTVSYPGTAVALSAPEKEGYYRALAHTQRHNLLKKLRRSRAELPLQTSVVTRPSDRELDEVFALFRQTYERGKTKFERLDRRFFERVREHDAAQFLLQRDSANGELVAFMLVFRIGDRLINKFIGLDYRRGGKTYLYFRLFDAAVDFACREGAKEIQSGQTGYRAKFDLGHRLVPLWNVFRHENPVVHLVFSAIGRQISWPSLDADLAEYLRVHPTSGGEFSSITRRQSGD